MIDHRTVFLRTLIYVASSEYKKGASSIDSGRQHVRIRCTGEHTQFVAADCTEHRSKNSREGFRENEVVHLSIC